MTQFERKGHYRISKYGVEHWVSGATVNRDQWDRWSSDYSPQLPHDPFLARYPEFQRNGKYSACFVNPNARCPVCGDRVFYYQNENGSRVFFDELGPPWPKHPCTDRLANYVAVDPSAGKAPIGRTRSAIAEITNWVENGNEDFAADFAAHYGSQPWSLATIVKRLRGEDLVFLVLKLLHKRSATKLYVSCKSLPKCCREGYLVAVQRGKISFFDPASDESKIVNVRRYRGAAAFIDAMVPSHMSGDESSV